VLQLPHIQCEGGYCCDSNVSLFNLWSIGNLYWIILIFNTRIISFSFSLWVIFLILLMFHLSQFENASLWNTWFYCDFTCFPTHILQLIFSSSLDSKGILIYLNVQKLRVNVLELHCIRKCSSGMVEPMLKAALCILFISLVNV
jgi:hypothetical protein